MKKKNIILICIVAVVIVICILGVVIGFGLDRSQDKDNKKDKVKLSQDLLEDEGDSEKETESATQEETTGTGNEIEYSTDETTTEEATTEEVTTEEVTTEEATVEETTAKEDEIVEPETVIVEKEINRLSYEYLIIDGKSVYSEYSIKIEELYNCINAERAKAGKKALTFDKDISYIACARASLMAYENTVTGSEQVQYYDLMKDSGINFTMAVENTAAGYTLASEVVSGSGTSWKTSAKHYENMISDKYTKVGVGVDYSDTMGYVWVAIFSN